MRLTFFCLVIILLSTRNTNAQVTIGSDNAPEEFSALQLDGEKRGLRLSRLTTSDRNALNVAGNSAAKGLVIYNVDTEKIEFYDGTTWISMGQPHSVSNGLTKNVATGKIELGGDLIEATTIEQEANKMTFTTGTGTLSVNTDVFSATNNTLAANADNFVVNDGTTDVFAISKTATGNTINANIASSSLNVNSGALSVSGSRTTVGESLTYKDTGGTYGVGKVLTSKADGEAYWKTLEPSAIIKDFKISVDQGTATADGSDGTLGTNLSTSASPITDVVTLEPGKWIITGMLYTYTRNQATNGTSTNLITMRLFDVTNNKALYFTGELPEAKASGGTSYNGGSFSGIPITCYIEVPSSINVRIDAYTPISNTYLIYCTPERNGYAWIAPNGSTFRAIRVNDYKIQ